MVNSPADAVELPDAVIVDFNDHTQVLRLGLAALFATVAVARGATADQSLVKQCVVCVDALLDAIVAE